MRRTQRWLVGLLLFGSAAVVGCSEPRACTVVGCYDGIGVEIRSELLTELRRPFTVELCVDGVCDSHVFDEESVGQAVHLFRERANLRAGRSVPLTVRSKTLEVGL